MRRRLDDLPPGGRCVEEQVEVLPRVDLEQKDGSASIGEEGAEGGRDRALADAALAGHHQELQLVEPFQYLHGDIQRVHSP